MGRRFRVAVSQPLVIETVDLAPPGPGELCVRVLATGLCHSDLSVINGTRPRPTPMVLGHEATGEIVELGTDVQGFRVGDRVVCYFVPGCGRCTPCATGRPSLCEPGAASNPAGTLLSGERRWRDADGIPCNIIWVSQDLPNILWYPRTRRCASVTIWLRRSRHYSDVP